MTASKDFTPWDFIKLVKELNEHQAEMKIKLANAGVGGAAAQTSSTSRP